MVSKYYLLTYYCCLPEINVYRPNMQQLYPKNQQFVLLFQARMTSILLYPSSIWRIFWTRIKIDNRYAWTIFFFVASSRNFCINCFLVVTEFAWKLLDLDYGAYVVCIHMYANNAAQNARHSAQKFNRSGYKNFIT